MFPLILSLLFLLLIGIILFRIHNNNTHFVRRKLPPGPFPLPIIGSIHLLGNHPHRVLDKLSKVYGPIMSIRLGNVETVVLSSSEATKLFLGTHDEVFCSRPQMQASKFLSYGTKGIAFAEYGPHWRSMRKLCTMELLSSAKLSGYSNMRKEEIELSVDEVRASSMNNKVVNLSEVASRLIEKMTFRMLFGKKSYKESGFHRVVEESSQVVGAFNLADYVPLLAPLDLQGLTRRIKLISKECDNMLETIIKDHERDIDTTLLRANDDDDHMCFIDVLLSLERQHLNSQGDQSYSIDKGILKAVLLDLIVGAGDASSTSIEWVLSVLIKYPRVMKKLRQELKDVVGEKKMVDEKDLRNLSYLEMIIKETFRLYPTAPLLVPRASTKDVIINGYHIPKKTHVLVNFWAFGRDSNIWSETCDDFMPERFLDEEIDLYGQDFELIPFGVGRRGCPGLKLGLINTGLVVSQLVHSFDWDLPNGMSPSDLNMDERFGLSMPRAKPLLAVPTYRL
uniref:cytochrome P450 CYP736A12-like n=1 Tax=Erigeron canadensis TaxID=72917 RepID=UPI001CB9AE09|nr:cytochrome P450 CYP736A12-like [Erigeron canadensis]